MRCQILRDDTLEMMDDRQPCVILCSQNVHVVLECLFRILRVDLSSVTYNKYGKPDVGGFYFNLSHSGKYGVIAYHPTRAIGVDIEKIRSLQNMDAVVRKMFHPYERITYEESVDPVSYFYHVWTYKEAYLKKVGIGLCMDARLIFMEESEDVFFLYDIEGYIICVNYSSSRI